MINIYFILMVLGAAYSFGTSVLAVYLIERDPVTYELYRKPMMVFAGLTFVVGLIASLFV